MGKKDVTILASSSTGAVATNAKERTVWKAKQNKDGSTTYSFSHVEKLKPTHTTKEFIEVIAPTNPIKKEEQL